MEKIDYTKFKLSKDDVIWKIRNDCLREMYAKSQPSANYNDVLQYYKDCEQSGVKPEKIYERYYLSYEEFVYIENKYLELYNLQDSFKDNCDIIIRDMEEGCVRDKHIPAEVIDGMFHPAHRGYEKVPPLKDLIGEENANKVVEFIKDRKCFYRFNKDESKFRFNVALTDSPTSNMEEVIKYWKAQGKEIKIDPRHHDSDYFWSEENGYLEEE